MLPRSVWHLPSAMFCLCLWCEPPTLVDYEAGDVLAHTCFMGFKSRDYGDHFSIFHWLFFPLSTFAVGTTQSARRTSDLFFLKDGTNLHQSKVLWADWVVHTVRFQRKHYAFLAACLTGAYSALPSAHLLLIATETTAGTKTIVPYVIELARSTSESLIDWTGNSSHLTWIQSKTCRRTSSR